VVLSRRNAINFFVDGKYDDAKHYAMEVLNIAMDNAPAMFIMAYYEEFTEKRNDSIKSYFQRIKDLALEYDEVREMINLIKASAYRMVSYEEDIIELFAKNMQSDESRDELRTILDTLCPYFISKRTSSDYLNENLTGMYKELIGHCGIPRTCFALLDSIEKNPDSPYVDRSFYLHAKCEYYYEHYVVPIGDIIGTMGNDEWGNKFRSVYEAKKNNYMKDAGITGRK
jgi:hypothetical protein